MTDADRLAEYHAFLDEFGTGEAEWADTSPEGIAHWRATHPAAVQIWSMTEVVAAVTYRLQFGSGMTRRQLAEASL